jgi:ATP-dependent DNA helicase RecG
MDPLQSSLQFLKGVGPRRAADLKRAGLSTVEDLLYRFPTRYEDRGHFQTIGSLKPGVAASIAAEVLSCGMRPTRRPRFTIFEMLVRDSSGSLRAIFFNQPFLKDVFRPHQRLILFGKLELSSHGLQMQSPQYEILSGDEPDGEAPAAGDAAPETPIHTGRIVPIYEKTGQLTAKMQRSLVYQALAPLPPALVDPIPEAIRIRL